MHLKRSTLSLPTVLLSIVTAVACDPVDEFDEPIHHEAAHPFSDAPDELAALPDAALDGLDACLAGCAIDQSHCVQDALANCDYFAEGSPSPLIEDSCTYQLWECQQAVHGCEADCLDGGLGDDGGAGDDGGDDGGNDDGSGADGGSNPDPGDLCSSCPNGQGCHCGPFQCWPDNVPCA